MKIIDGTTFPNLKLDCYNCNSRCIVDLLMTSKYWICPKCRRANSCKNLIEALMKDTILSARAIGPDGSTDDPIIKEFNNEQEKLHAEE